ncbi:hypothetical protein WS98_08960 [Burkholderia territorii]|nr:hypothetical protein WS94_20235 [Burkholderia territorii]KVL39430.1 hypothetical protein WS98_08960 [Burkholderia territorii]KWA06168.1 hypothetical protein WT36_16405 [Burkholderia territorii]KWA19969.1 hypothetical protein WT38_21855 [Burkholderia territorii]KWA37379.1 hypothetical protein WT41_27320 [Burkholderia territorii]
MSVRGAAICVPPSIRRTKDVEIDTSKHSASCRGIEIGDVDGQASVAMRDPVVARQADMEGVVRATA